MILAAMAAGVITVSCDREPKFKIAGEVTGGEGKTLVLSKPDFAGRWITLDSVKIDSDGKFTLESAAPGAPEIYRLSLGDRFVYFPIDSVESLKLTTSAANYGHEFTLTGTPDAERLSSFEHELLGFTATDSTARADFKKALYSKYIQDSKGSILSYYVLTKTINGVALFDPADKQDSKYYGAVATQYEQFKPDDPHGKMVREASIRAMRDHNSRSGKRQVVQAREIQILEIELPDENGKTVKLTDYAGKGKPVALIFGLMNHEDSPAFNRELAQLYNRLGGRVTFFDVSLDADQYAWRDAARNLPWITVFDASGMSSNVVRDYNLQQLPVIYIYNGNGDLVDRAASVKDLESKLSAI